MNLILCRTLCASFCLFVLMGCAHRDAFGVDNRTFLYGNPQTLVSAERPYCLPTEVMTTPAAMIKASMPSDTPVSTYPLSAGDLIEVTVAGDDTFSGQFVLDHSGRLHIPYVDPIAVAGKTTEQSRFVIESALIRQRMLKAGMNDIDVQMRVMAPVQVAVAGAVFEAGRVTINNPHPDQLLEQRLDATGDQSYLRTVSGALRAASGVRPDADLSRVVVIRNGWQHVVDLSGVLFGHKVRDFPLVDGDSVYVPSTNCFDERLVKPTEITPRGFRVFLSNLILPATDNASGAVGRYATNLPYGTRLLQAAVSANCIGGIQSTNAPRHVVLASTNPLTGEVQVVQRSVEALMRGASHADTNPYLMPNDAVACYDSAVSNFRDIARTLTDLITPFRLL